MVLISELTYPAALFAGALSFLSPCVLPLVPPYLCYIAGVTAEDLRAGLEEQRVHRKHLIGTALAFVLGFSTVFVLLGLGASSVGQILRQNIQGLSIFAGLLITGMGFHFLGMLRLPFISREFRLQSSKAGGGTGAAYVMGLAFAFGWTPCIGPVLGAILGLAGSKQTSIEGASLLAVYSAGLGIPFVLAASFSGVFMRVASRLRHHLGTVEKVMGVFLIATGILFLSGGLQRLSFWMLETFPVFQTIG